MFKYLDELLEVTGEKPQGGDETLLNFLLRVAAAASTVSASKWSLLSDGAQELVIVVVEQLINSSKAASKSANVKWNWILRQVNADEHVHLEMKLHAAKQKVCAIEKQIRALILSENVEASSKEIAKEANHV